MEKEYNVLVFREGEVYVARCVELLIVETGSSEKNALNNLKKCISELLKTYKLISIQVDLESYYSDFSFVKHKIKL